jgi:hypothetical protein
MHRDTQTKRNFTAEGQVRDRAEEKHRDTHSGWDFMAEDQTSETELRRSTRTHSLEGISWWKKVRDQRQS